MGMFDTAAAKRKSETQATEKKLKTSKLDETKETINHTEKPIVSNQEKKKDTKLTKLTLSVTEEDRQKAKIYAATHNTSISKMFHEMVAKL